MSNFSCQVIVLVVFWCSNFRNLKDSGICNYLNLRASKHTMSMRSLYDVQEWSIPIRRSLACFFQWSFVSTLLESNSRTAIVAHTCSTKSRYSWLGGGFERWNCVILCIQLLKRDECQIQRWIGYRFRGKQLHHTWSLRFFCWATYLDNQIPLVMLGVRDFFNIWCCLGGSY